MNLMELPSKWAPPPLKSVPWETAALPSTCQIHGTISLIPLLLQLLAVLFRLFWVWDYPPHVLLYLSAFLAIKGWLWGPDILLPDHMHYF